MRCSRLSGLVVVFGAFAVSSSAQAQTQPPPRIGVQLAYVLGRGAERSCPDETHMRRELAAGFGYDPIQSSAPSRLTIAITPGRGGIHLALMELRDAGGAVGWKGHHEAYDCHILVRGVALTVQIGIERIAPRISPPAPEPARPEPVVVAPRPEPEPVTAEARPARTPAPPSKATASAPVRAGKTPAAPASDGSPISRLLVDAGLGGAFRLGAAPAPNFSVALQGGLRWPFMSLNLEARGDLPASGEEEFSTSRLTGSILPCGHYKIVVGCLVGAVGREHASTEEDDGSAWFAGMGGRLSLEVPLFDPIMLRVSGDLIATMGENLSVDLDGESQWVAPPIYGTFCAGFAARW
jgi:hypothetical protein